MFSTRCLLLGVVLAGIGSAQVPISGTIHDGAGGPLLTGVVYHTASNLLVPAGRTLTVQAGAIVKFDGDALFVEGTLACAGTAALPVILTSVHDDAAGGDTNGNGSATVPVANQWCGVSFGDGADASALDHTVIRYTGWAYWPAVALSQADVRLWDCSLSDGSNGGMRLDADSRPAVARCGFARFANHPAVFGAAVAAVPGFVDNTVSDCPGGSYLRVDGTTLDGAATIGPRNALSGGAIVYANHLTVAQTGVLTLEAGTVLKPNAGHGIFVHGTLAAHGTGANPVVLTSFQDDAAGGDTNGDGNATAPAANQWCGVQFTDTADASALAHTTVRYTGWAYWPAVDCQGASLAMSDCTISDASNGGMRLDATARPAVSRCRFLRIANAPAVYGVHAPAVAGFVDCTASACPGGAFLRIDGTAVGESVTFGPRNAMNGIVPNGGALVYSHHLTVAAGVSLTLDPGTVLKPFGGYAVLVDGTLRALGTESEPVVFTSFEDDAAGGDTNGDGNATAPAPNQWCGLKFTDTADASVLEHAIVRYTGWAYCPTIDCAAADISVSSCTLSDASNGGMRLDPVARPTVTDTRFERVDRHPAVFGADLAAVPGFRDNTATGCSGGNYLRVDSTALTLHATIEADQCLGGALVYASHLTIAQGASLTLGSGVVLKPVGGLGIVVAGRLQTRGLVVFTSFQDDAFGGDTNGDANATVAGINQWCGLRIEAGAVGALDGVLVRCTGWAYWPAVQCASPQFALRRSRVEMASNGGFSLSDAAVAADLTAYLVVGDGVSLSGGSFPLQRSTAAYCTRYGCVRTPAWTGVVHSSLAWGNGVAGFEGFAADQIVYSDGPGIVGGVGNRNADPLFLDPGSGDLRLRAGSPCIDAGHPGDAPAGRDMLDFPRFLDGNLLGVQRVDMGSHEFDNVVLRVGGDAAPGSVLTFTSTATRTVQFGVMLVGAEAAAPLPLFNFGNAYVALGAASIAEVWPPNGTVALTVPPTIGTPVSVGFQLFGLCAQFPRGNASNPVFVAIR